MVRWKIKFCAIPMVLLFNLIGIENRQLCKSSKIVVGNKAPLHLVGFFPIRNSIPRMLINEALPWVESMRYTIEQANVYAGRELFGYTFYDRCSLEEDHYPFIESIVDMILGNYSIEQNDNQCLCLDSYNNLHRTIGIIGPTDSSSTILLNSFIQLDEIPVVGYGATSVELNDKYKYPQFFRSVPDDTFQAILINDIVLHFKWNYVSLVIGDNDYGRNGATTLKQRFGNSVCIDLMETVSDVYNEDKYLEIINKLKRESSSNVIIVWSWFDQVKNLLMLAQKVKLWDKIWIFTEAVSRTAWFTDFKKTFEGNMLIIVKTAGENELFKQHFLNITYGDSIEDNHPWLNTFFSNNNVTHLNTTIGDSNHIFDFTLAGFVQNSVNVLISAFYDYQREFNLRNSSNFNIDKTEFNKLVKRVSFTDLRNETFRFDNNHNRERNHFAIYLVKEGRYEKLTVWSSLENSKFEYFEHDSIQNVTSICSTECPPGKTAIFDENKPCCWICVKCSNFSVKSFTGQHKCEKCPHVNDYFPNRNLTKCLQLKRIYWSLQNANHLLYVLVVFSISLIGALISVIFIITFIKNRNTPIIRSSNFHISMLQLCIQFIVFLYPVLMLGEETRGKCIVKYYGVGLLFVIIITLILMKLTRLVHVFCNLRILSKKDRYNLNSKQMLIFFGSVCVYGVVIMVIENSHPLHIEEVKDFKLYTLHIVCTDHNFIFVHVFYELIIILLCAIQCFKGRNIPWKYNEARYIGFALFSSTIVGVVTIPIGRSIIDHNKYMLLLCLVKLISNLLLLLILYGYKIFIICFVPEENTVQSFQSASMANIMQSTQYANMNSTCKSVVAIRNKQNSLNEPSIDSHRKVNDISFSMPDSRSGWDANLNVIFDTPL